MPTCFTAFSMPPATSLPSASFSRLSTPLKMAAAVSVACLHLASRLARSAASMLSPCASAKSISPSKYGQMTPLIFSRTF